jgi:hypothetical protein
MVVLATLVHANAALTAQLPRNHTALHHAATLAVSRTVSFGKGAASTRLALSSDIRVVYVAGDGGGSSFVCTGR